MSSLKETAPGIGITLTIAAISTLASFLHPSFDALVISIIFGMLVANILGDRGVIEGGVKASLKVFLPVGIGLYGVQLTFVGIGAGVGSGISFWPALPEVAAIFVATFGVTYMISRGFGLDRRLSFLLGTGLSVCGASAIAVISPLIRAREEDTSISIISVMAVGLTGMLIYRFMHSAIGLPAESMALLAGGTLPMFGQVKVASLAIGGEGAALAVNFKLLRISALAVLACAAVAYAGRGKKRFYAPWFMVVFFVLAVAANVSGEVAGLRKALNPISTFSLAAALAAIGLSIDFDSVTERGASPLFAAFLSWGIVSMTLYLILSVAA